MPTKTDVYNMTLGLLGQSLVDSDLDDTENTRVLNVHWPTVVERCHEKTEWDFARLRHACARHDTTPIYQYRYYYTQPPDLLRLLHVSETGEDGDDLIHYNVEVGKIAADVETLFISYVSSTSINAVGRWSTSFAYYVATELALLAAPKINPDAVDLIMKERKKASSDAIGLDATQGPPIRRRHGSWSGAALGHRVGRNREHG